MKKMIGLLFILTILLTGCSNDDTLSYTVLFERNNETTLNGVKLVDDGGYIDSPDDPIYEGNIFSGWYTEESLTNLYTFGSEITGDFTLYAKWTPSEGVEEDIDLTTLPYYDYLSETNPVITIEVQDFGTMVLELFPDVAPNTVNNYIMYIENGAFSGNTFHRVIEDFMIQGGNTYSTICPIEGDFLANGVDNDLSHYRGTISMARTSFMNSATSQFFIVHADSTFLDGNYATYGGLVSGFDILDEIAVVDTDVVDRPLTTITISSITVDLNGYVAVDPICAD